MSTAPHTTTTPMRAAAGLAESEPFACPADLFTRNDGASVRLWTCVRTRPRWEKKFARWLRAEHMPYFLPTYLRKVLSHRKRRTTVLPLFPGYVFVVGDHTKQRFIRSESVVRLLKPRCLLESRALDAQLASIWLALSTGLPLAPTSELEVGQRVEITEGPLRGATGKYLRTGQNDCLVVVVDMLGCGVRVELPADCRVNPE